MIQYRIEIAYGIGDRYVPVMITPRRDQAISVIKSEHGAGRWVEVYNDRSGELIGGPYDPGACHPPGWF